MTNITKVNYGTVEVNYVTVEVNFVSIFWIILTLDVTIDVYLMLPYINPNIQWVIELGYWGENMWKGYVFTLFPLTLKIFTETGLWITTILTILKTEYSIALEPYEIWILK